MTFRLRLLYIFLLTINFLTYFQKIHAHFYNLNSGHSTNTLSVDCWFEVKTKHFTESVGPKMAETSLRTFWYLVLALIFNISATSEAATIQDNLVTFVGFVNDHHNKFSALLEVEVEASSLPEDVNLWLASKDPEACIGKAVYGRAKVEPVHDGLFRVGLNYKWNKQINKQ